LQRHGFACGVVSPAATLLLPLIAVADASRSLLMPRFHDMIRC